MDGGATGALLVRSMLGFYAIPGTDQYVVGALAFPQATIAIAGGTFTIDAPDVSDKNIYVRSFTLNGAPLDTPILHHADFRPGGSLVFGMGSQPTDWGGTRTEIDATF